VFLRRARILFKRRGELWAENLRKRPARIVIAARSTPFVTLRAYPVLQAFDAPNGDFRACDECVEHAAASAPDVESKLFRWKCAQRSRKKILETRKNDEQKSFPDFAGHGRHQKSEVKDLLDLFGARKKRIGRRWVIYELATGNMRNQICRKSATPTQLRLHGRVACAADLDERSRKE